MELKEFRIGNYIAPDGLIDQDYQIGEEDFFCYKTDKYLQGMPINSAWLHRFGFYEFSDVWSIDSGGISLFFNKSSKEIEICFSGNWISLPHIKYIHQIQNLWFDLTGKEL